MENEDNKKAAEKLGAEVMELSRNMLLVDFRFLDTAISKLVLSPSDIKRSLL